MTSPKWWQWRPYVAWGRRQLRIGVRRHRSDRWCDEYRFLGLERGW